MKTKNDDDTSLNTSKVSKERKRKEDITWSERMEEVFLNLVITTKAHIKRDHITWEQLNDLLFMQGVMEPFIDHKINNAENLVEDGVDKDGNTKYKRSNISYRKLDQILGRLIDRIKKVQNTSSKDHSKLYEHAKQIDEEMSKQKAALELEKKGKTEEKVIIYNICNVILLIYNMYINV